MDLPEIPVNDLKLEKVELLEDGKTSPCMCPTFTPPIWCRLIMNYKSAEGIPFKGRIDHTIHEVE